MWKCSRWRENRDGMWEEKTDDPVSVGVVTSRGQRLRETGLLGWSWSCLPVATSTNKMPWRQA